MSSFKDGGVTRIVCDCCHMTIIDLEEECRYGKYSYHIKCIEEIIFKATGDKILIPFRWQDDVDRYLVDNLQRIVDARVNGQLFDLCDLLPAIIHSNIKNLKEVECDYTDPDEVIDILRQNKPKNRKDQVCKRIGVLLKNMVAADKVVHETH